MTTSDPLFKLVGAKRYEEQGGQYEDDLFGAAERYGDRKITDSAIVLSIARAVADVQKKRLLATTQKTFPTTSDVLFPPSIRRGPMPDRKSVVSGKSVSVRVDLGGRRIIKKKTITKKQ